VFFSDPRLPEDGPWHWPLRVGFLDDPDSVALCSKTARAYRHQDLISIRPVKSWPRECDLILVPGLPDASALEALRAAPAGMILIVPEPSQPLPTLQDLVSLSGKLPRSAFATLRPTESLTQGFLTLVDELSHDRRLDAALGLAAGDPEHLILLAQPRWLSYASISGFLDRIDLALKEHHDLGELSSEALRHSGPKLKQFRDLITEFGFTSEEGVARRIADGMEEVRHQPLAPPPPSPVIDLGTIDTFTGADVQKMTVEIPKVTRMVRAKPPTKEERHLQCEIFEIDGPGRLERHHSFRAGRAHQIIIRIGPSDGAWLQAKDPFPYEGLPPAQRHELDVILSPRWPEAVPQCEKIYLRPEGPSSQAWFDLEIPSGLKELEILVQILHKGRHIQTGCLIGSATNTEDGADPGAVIVFLISHQAQADLAHQQEADLTLLCESDTVCIHCNGQDRPPRRLPMLQAWVNKVREILSDAAQKTTLLNSGLATGAGLGLLRALATRGAYLREQVFKSVEPLPPSTRVEVISQCSTESLPLEFLYDFVTPDGDAALCPKYLETPLAHPCPDCTFQKNAKFVCPFGFWGLNREIGRQLVDPSSAVPRPGFAPEASAGRPSLPPLKSLQMAATVKVDEGAKGLTNRTFKAINTVLGGHAKIVNTWPLWKDGIATDHPSILLLLVHNEDDPAGSALEIGNHDLIQLVTIVEDYIATPGSGVVPIVLLLGCDTASASIGFEDFIARFREMGAGIVVGTTTKALGPQVAPAAEEFIRQICSQKSRGTGFAELMRLARTNLLRDGNLLSLGLVAYGDADWLIS